MLPTTLPSTSTTTSFPSSNKLFAPSFSGYVKSNSSNNNKSILSNLRSNSLFYWFLGLLLALPYAFYHHVQIYESSWISHLTLGAKFCWGWMSSEKTWSLLHQMGEEGRYHHMMYQGIILFILVAFVKLFWRFDKRALWVNILFGIMVLSSLLEKIMIGLLVHRALYMETVQGEKEFNSVDDFSNEYSTSVTVLNFIGKSDIWIVVMILVDVIVKPKLIQASSFNRKNYQF